jgi:hypothetical protein
VDVIEGKTHIECGEKDPAEIDEAKLKRNIEFIPNIPD